MWHYTIDNNPQDPVDEATIAHLAGSGTIHANTLVWREGMADWLPLASTELAQYAPPKPRTLVCPTPGQFAMPSIQSQALAPNPYAPPQAAPHPGQFALRPQLTWGQILWSFEGRIPRRTYWAGIGIWIGIYLAVILLTAGLAPIAERSGNEILAMIPLMLFIIPYIWSLIAMQVKRWHDRGKPGAMVLVNLIPFVGGIWAFVECGCLRGTVGQNMYGRDPT